VNDILVMRLRIPIGGSDATRARDSRSVYPTKRLNSAIAADGGDISFAADTKDKSGRARLNGADRLFAYDDKRGSESERIYLPARCSCVRDVRLRSDARRFARHRGQALPHILVPLGEPRPLVFLRCCAGTLNIASASGAAMLPGDVPAGRCSRTRGGLPALPTSSLYRTMPATRTDYPARPRGWAGNTNVRARRRDRFRRRPVQPYAGSSTHPNR
jgi:hypothetical protein